MLLLFPIFQYLETGYAGISSEEPEVVKDQNERVPQFLAIRVQWEDAIFNS